ncbi:hypothetical protein E2C01_032089 [Portunus trituberculatus]|uniref:Uncharacterized protein n=1 Tax=Portunus trituberculatus TaxID=210409 RepID=A0A5B7EUG6_PORTR|nr:hypothetical protein [Portunus trituberculatus]
MTSRESTGRVSPFDAVEHPKGIVWSQCQAGPDHVPLSPEPTNLLCGMGPLTATPWRKQADDKAVVGKENKESDWLQEEELNYLTDWCQKTTQTKGGQRLTRGENLRPWPMTLAAYLYAGKAICQPSRHPCLRTLRSPWASKWQGMMPPGLGRSPLRLQGCEVLCVCWYQKGWDNVLAGAGHSSLWMVGSRSAVAAGMRMGLGLYIWKMGRRLVIWKMGRRLV